MPCRQSYRSREEAVVRGRQMAAQQLPHMRSACPRSVAPAPRLGSLLPWAAEAAAANRNGLSLPPAARSRKGQKQPRAPRLEAMPASVLQASQGDPPLGSQSVCRQSLLASTGGSADCDAAAGQRELSSPPQTGARPSEGLPQHAPPLPKLGSTLCSLCTLWPPQSPVPTTGKRAPPKRKTQKERRPGTSTGTGFPVLVGPPPPKSQEGRKGRRSACLPLLGCCFCVLWNSVR